MAHFAKIRSRYSNIPIYVPYFMNGFIAYNNAFDEIASTVSDIKMVSSRGAALQDPYHWNYVGMKIVADNLINKWIK